MSRTLARPVIGLAVTIAAHLFLLQMSSIAATPNLVAAYSFNEGSGSVVGDASGTGNTGTLSLASWAAVGKFGGALSFNGTSSSVLIPEAASLDLTTGMTLEAWVNPISSTGWRTVILKESPVTGLAYGLYASGDTNQPLGYVNLAGTDRFATASPAIPLNAWTHVAVTYDGAVIRLYVNGVARATTTAAGALPATTSPLRIGGNASWGEYFNGMIDEVRVYNRALSVTEILADMTVPVDGGTFISLTAPATGAQVAGAVAVTASGSVPVGIAGVQFKVDGANFGAEDTVAPYSITWDTTLIGDGTHTLSATMRDNNGVTLTSSIVSVSVANTVPPPTVSLTAPAAGANVSATVTVSASASATGGVAGVQFKLDGNNLGAEDTTSPYSTSWNTTAIANGAHSLTATVRATSGATATSLPISVNVNNAAPTISLTAPAAGASVSATVTVSASASATGGVAGVQFKLDGSNLGVEDTTSPYSTSWNTTAIANGAHSLTATVRATGGATATSLPISVNVNNAGPTISLTAPTAGATVSATVTVSASASASGGVAGVQFKLDGNNLGVEDTTSPYSTSWNTTAVTNGTHSLTATVRATGGATATSLPISVNVNNAAPTISLTAPAAGANVSASVTISASATATGGVAGVQFKLDGNNLGAEDTTSPYSTTWNTTAIANGTHSLTATVRATGGATATSLPISVNVNNVGTPTISLTAPAAGTVTGTTAVTASASDSSGIAGVQFLLDGANLGAEATVSPYSFAWNTTTAANGSHTLSARARNTLGGTATTATVTVNVANGLDPTVYGQWSGVQTWPIVPVNTILLNTGKVLTFDRVSAGPTAQLWDPLTNVFTNVPNGFTDLFCSGHSILADGRILIVGGHGPVNAGTADVNIFDPVSQTWTLGPRMAYERWYPSTVLLPSGKVFAFTGIGVNGADYITVPELYDPATNSWSKLTGAAANMFSYGQAFLLPNGKLGYAGNWEFDDNARVLDLNTQTWTVLDPNTTPGYSVMYEPGKILKVGSSSDSGTAGPSSATAYLFDFTAVTPAWQQIASMQYPRTHHNLSMLPDGNVLVSGGSAMKEGYIVENAVLTPEMWSPVTKTFTPMAPHVKPRLYHSEALLLPDGRVLVSGGGRDGTGIDQFNVEIFSPPYLFKGARPAITSSPATATYGNTFFIATPDAASISSVTLIRDGSVTHGVNMDQRFLNLSFQQTAGGLSVTAPANANLAPPGPYMVFLVNSNGVPSVGSFVSLPLPSVGPPPAAPSSLSGTGGFGTSSLTWTAPLSGSGIGNYNVHRSTSTGFLPTTANRIAQPASTSYVDSGLSGGPYYYVVTAEDVNHLVGPPSSELLVNVLTDSQPPTVSLTAPTTTSVSGSITISAAASDNAQVAGVQFLLDGANLGLEITAPPYSMVWSSLATTNGAHTLAARARDNAGNSTTTPVLNITVTNTLLSGLVAAYSFSEGSGTTTLDQSGNNNTGALSGATWSAAGKTGNALSFNGTSARVTIADSSSLRLTNGMTLEAWVQPSAISGWRTILLKEDTAELAYSLYANGGNDRPGTVIHLASGSQVAVGTAQLPLNTWTHVAATFNGTVLRFFINGAQVGSLNVTGSMIVTTKPLQIGGNQVWGEYFQGLIDDVRVYNRALSPAEIQSDMSLPVAP